MGSFACYNNYYTPGGLWYVYGPSGAMGEIAEELQIAASPLTGQSDSEGSNSSLELGNSVARIALSPTNKSTSAIKCRWLECGRWFANLELLAAHVTRVHATSGRGGLFYCGWEGCSRGDRGFNARYKMLVHVRTHTNEKPHHCFKCDKSFSRAENLKIHARSHTGERPYVCPVPGCGKAYSNSSDRFKHTRTHSVDKPYCCKVPGCPKRYTDPSSLRKHVKTYRHFPGMSEELEDSARQTIEDGSSTLTSTNQLFDRINLDSNVFTMDKRATNNANIQESQSNSSRPKSVKRDCNGLLKLDLQKDCGDNQHSATSAESLPQCCRVARDKFGEEMARYCHLNSHHTWDDHDTQYNLFRSWINADLSVMSRSLPWGLSLWSHALMQPQLHGGLPQSCFVPDTIKPSHVERHSISSQSSEEAIDDQDLPLDLTVHHESNRT